MPGLFTSLWEIWVDSDSQLNIIKLVCLTTFCNGEELVMEISATEGWPSARDFQVTCLICSISSWHLGKHYINYVKIHLNGEKN